MTVKIDESAYSAEDGLKLCDCETEGGSAAQTTAAKTGDAGGLIAAGAPVAIAAAGATAAGLTAVDAR